MKLLKDYLLTDLGLPSVLWVLRGEVPYASFLSDEINIFLHRDLCQWQVR